MELCYIILQAASLLKMTNHETAKKLPISIFTHRHRIFCDDTNHHVMRHWQHKIYLADIFERELDEDNLAETVRDICSRLRESAAKVVEDFLEKVDELENQADDLEGFEYEWNLFYDFCDDNNIWIETLIR